ncbi:MAG: methylenetetrahydrofolate reductase [NAD(P)H] [Alphaproteobacteria bacterium]|nr:methylenetetrahydrofolate reductase [NAD(P)H] [Alphaproteobacteria bacterium]
MSTLSIADRQSDSAPSVSFEFFPPKSDAMAERLWQTVQRLEPMAPDFVSVTYGAGGSTRERTHDTVKRIAGSTLLLPAAHLTCVSATKEEVLDVADGYWDAGIRHIVALRGDATEGMGAVFQQHPGGFRDSVELIAGLREHRPELGRQFEISVSCYPEQHPDSLGWDQDIAFLKAKQDAGADRAISQFFFEPDTYLRFLERARAGGVTMPIIPGIMLQPNFNGLKRISTLCGATLPDWLHGLYEGLDDDEETRDLVTANVAAELCHKLADEGVDKFHFYTLNRAGLALSTCRLLGMKPKPAKAA